jgi:hypothetical protein
MDSSPLMVVFARSYEVLAASSVGAAAAQGENWGRRFAEADEHAKAAIYGLNDTGRRPLEWEARDRSPWA